MSENAKVRPFSNGSQFADWTASNCERCAKGAPIGSAEWPTCPIEYALAYACIDDGTITQEIADRMGYEHSTARYVWMCCEWLPSDAWKEEWKRKHEAKQ